MYRLDSNLWFCCSVHGSERKHNCSHCSIDVHQYTRAQLKPMMSANVCRRADVATIAMHEFYINILIHFYLFAFFVLVECECFDWREPKTRCHTQNTHAHIGIRPKPNDKTKEKVEFERMICVERKDKTVVNVLIISYLNAYKYLPIRQFYCAIYTITNSCNFVFVSTSSSPADFIFNIQLCIDHWSCARLSHRFQVNLLSKLIRIVHNFDRN